MSIPVTCPSGHLLKVADNMAGRAGRCPLCREIVNVPELRRAVEGEKSSTGGRSRLGRGAANPAAAAKSASAGESAPVAPEPIAPDPAAADTVLMPLNLGETPVSDGPALAAQQAAAQQVVAEPDLPVAAEPELMAQTLPLPTAELMPKRSVGAADPTHDLGFDTAGHKARIIGSWKVLGDVEPPYVPEVSASRSGSAAVAATETKAVPAPTADKNDGVHANVAAVRTAPVPPPLPAVPSAAAATAPSPSRRESSGSVAKKSSLLRRPITARSPRSLHATVYRIAGGLALVSIISMWPALRYWDLGVAPGWARGVLLVALLQFAYAAWLVSIPDWASLWALMFVLAGVATLYGTAAAMTLATPMEHDPPLGLQAVRHGAPYWCFCMMLLTTSAAYLCGHAAQRIRRSNGKGGVVSG